MSKKEKLPPNYSKLDKALRSIGYSFEAAVADIIDNSIDAKAKNIYIRIIVRNDKPLDLVIWDDGKGMSSKILKEAMRFGADVTQEIDRLGKFGLGMKLASLSQAKEVKVFTIKNGQLSGRAWLEEGIQNNFTCEIYNTNECEMAIKSIIPEYNLNKQGTIVFWSSLYRVGQNHHDQMEHANKIQNMLKNYLALAFHRFLEGRPRKIKIYLDIIDGSSFEKGLVINLEPVNPFKYIVSGNKNYPLDLMLEDDFKDRISIKAHIWPPNSSSSNYRLAGGANARQGFYFYRNNRLIQGGGWNGIRENESHSSLARLEIDISPNFDIEVSLDVKKVEIQLTNQLVKAIKNARSTSGVDFKKYLADADKAYRTRKTLESELPIIPSSGLPPILKKFLHSEYKLNNTSRHRDLKFIWANLEANLFFDVDRDKNIIFLNKIYRKTILNGSNPSSIDAPMIKCLLFMFLADFLYKEKWGSNIKTKINSANRILVQAIKIKE